MDHLPKTQIRRSYEVVFEQKMPDMHFKQKITTSGKGDIDLLPSAPKTGHFYFGNNRTFLLWLDRSTRKYLIKPQKSMIITLHAVHAEHRVEKDDGERQK